MSGTSVYSVKSWDEGRVKRPICRESNCMNEGTERTLRGSPRMPLRMVSVVYVGPRFLLTLCAAKENAYDVVLVDTAGRMQDNEPLMRALAKVSLSVVFHLRV
jgi:hypothetical protein